MYMYHLKAYILLYNVSLADKGQIKSIPTSYWTIAAPRRDLLV